MRLHRDIEGPLLAARGSVIAIGAFDGIHRGHRALLSQVRQRATALGLAAAAVSFEPLPRQFFARAPLLRLTPMSERLRQLAPLGLDHLLCLRFAESLAQTSAQDFIDRVLRARLAAREVWVGPGFRFGHGREGSFATLEAAGAAAGFVARELAPVVHAHERVSSSLIREALIAGDFDRAESWLGRRYRYTGRVVRGQQLGRKLGFPTANLRWPQNSQGMSGIYAVRVDGAGLKAHPGVASLGYRPTVGGKELLLEVHLFHFDGEIYGQRLSVDFIAKQRDEWHFPDLDSLVTQIRRDADEARALLGVARA